MNLLTPPARKRSVRAVTKAALIGVAAAGITVVAVPAAQAATPPVFPHNVVVFPQRDFVSIEGYDQLAFEGKQATITVTRNGAETSRAVGTITDGGLEVNHPGGVCWQGVTPDIKFGDVVRLSFPGGASDSTTTLRPEV